MAQLFPDWTRYWRVDEVIECLPISPDTQKMLLEVMPNAYDLPAPGEDAWQEHDPAREAPFKLSVIWAKLPCDVQANINQAWAAERGSRC